LGRETIDERAIGKGGAFNSDPSGTITSEVYSQVGGGKRVSGGP